MELDGEGNSNAEAGLVKTSNPPVKKLRTNMLLDFFEVMPTGPNGSANTLSANQSKYQGCTSTGGLTGTATKRPLDTRNVYCPIAGCGN